MKQILTVLAVTVFFLTSGLVVAQEGGRRPPGPPHPPPQEAFDACDGAEEGDECVVDTRRHGELEGVCRNPPQVDELVCVPNNHPRPPQRQ